MRDRMISKVEGVLLGLALMRVALAFDYRSTIMTQRITYYDNPHVGFNVKYFGDEGYPYLTLHDEVTHYHDLHVMLYARVYDQPPNLLANAPMSLCQLLYDESHHVNHTISQFRIPQIFNLLGENCPIEPRRIRLSPYIFPSNFSSDIDLGCGYMNVEARLMKCNDELESDDRQCETLMKTVTLVNLVNDKCVPATNATDDGWIIKKVDPRELLH